MAFNFKNNQARSVRKFVLLYFEVDVTRLANALKFVRYLGRGGNEDEKVEEGETLGKAELKPGNQITLGGIELPSAREEMTHQCKAA